MKKTCKAHLPMAIAAAMLSTPALASSTMTTSASDQKELSLTIYNGNLGLVRDVRSLEIDRNLTLLEFKDVSGAIDPSSAILTGVRGIRTQTFSYDLLNMQSLFMKHVGKEVEVKEAGRSEYKAKILSVSGNQVVIRGIDTDRQITGIKALPMMSDNVSFEFSEVPENLSASPTLSMQVFGTGNQEDVSLTYLTGGLSWQADYVAKLHDANQMDMRGWVTLNNTSQIDYSNAEIQLLAGDINRAQNASPVRKEQLFMAKAAMADSMVAEEAAVENLGDYKLYTIPFKVNVLNNQQQQATLFDSQNIAVEKKYVADTWVGSNNKQNASVEIHIKNEKEEGLGIPLPSGVMRFYEADSKGKDQFIGEYRIGHIGEKQLIKAPIGKAFGLTIKHKNIEMTNISRHRQELTQGWEIINSEDKPMTVTIAENGLGHGNEVVFKRHDVAPKKIREGTYEFTVTVGPKEKKNISYEATVYRP